MRAFDGGKIIVIPLIAQRIGAGGGGGERNGVAELSDDVLRLVGDRRSVLCDGLHGAETDKQQKHAARKFGEEFGHAVVHDTFCVAP